MLKKDVEGYYVTNADFTNVLYSLVDQARLKREVPTGENNKGLRPEDMETLIRYFDRKPKSRNAGLDA